MRTSRFVIFLAVTFAIITYLTLTKLFTKHEQEASDVILEYKTNIKHKIQGLKRKPQHKREFGIVTVFGEFGDYSKGNFEAYASRHGYKLFIGDAMSFEEQSLVTDNHGFKFQVIQRVMTENAELDWIFWCAPDSLILNHRIRLERVIDDRFHFILPLSPFGNLKDMAQTDHFLVRNSPQGRQIVDDLVRMSTRNCGFFLLEHPASSYAIDGWLHVCENDGNFWNGDLGLLLALYLFRESEYRCLFKRIGERMFSSRYPRYRPGDFVLGFREEASLITRRMLLKGALMYADVEKGEIDRKRTTSLEPSLDPGEGDWDKLEAKYSALNIPCDQIYNNKHNSEQQILPLVTAKLD